MIVGTFTGAIRGARSPRGGDRFLGIPFAAPPIGALRWRPPQPAAPWTGVRDALAFPPAPIQVPIPANHFMAQFSFAHPPESEISEDCLYLNVWRPEGADQNGKLPVVFWIFGGGHQVGSASHPVSWGEKLAARGCIVVAANYRLGAMGYLAHPLLTAETGASGNYASLDLIAALKWTKENIAAFGGDPARITLFGQSAGAAHANVLLASPPAKNLFHRAILTSGGAMRGGPMGDMKTLEEAEAAGEKLLNEIGAKDVAAMRALTAAQIKSPPRFWGLLQDGVVSPEPPHDAFKNRRHHAMPLMAGFTTDEAAPYPSLDLASLGGLRAFAETFGSRRDEFLQIYDARDDEAALVASYQVRRDLAFAYQAWRVARAMAQDKEAPVWLFQMDQAPPLPRDARFHEPTPPGGFGAYHGADLWYAFGNLDVRPWRWTAEDRSLADRLGTAIVNFAASGDPNGASGDWPRFEQTGGAMIFSGQSHAGPVTNERALRFFESVFLS